MLIQIGIVKKVLQMSKILILLLTTIMSPIFATMALFDMPSRNKSFKECYKEIAKFN